MVNKGQEGEDFVNHIAYNSFLKYFCFPGPLDITGDNKEICEAVNRHGASLRTAIASHGNDHRLGANEAPPSIISIFLGDITGQIFTLFILTVAAAEAAIGLAIIVVYYRNSGTIRVEEIDQLKG